MISFFATVQLLAAVGLNSVASNHVVYLEDTAVIRKTIDFQVSGNGDHAAWEKSGWQEFIKIDSGGKFYASKSKMLYSEKGIYLLFSGADDLISTKNYEDDDDIYEGDVFEFFLHTDPGKPAYFEYEINQLNKQLVLILSGAPNKNLAWSPWRIEYNKDPMIRKKTVLGDGTKKPGAKINGWTAEIFIPYEVLGLLPGLPPKSGMVWRANFCRIDYDSGKMIQYTWSKKINSSFHDLDKLGYIIFE